MSENEFFIVLPSNASLDLYPDNTTGCYMTHLQKEVKLFGKWSVGLAEIFVPHTISHLKEKDTHFKLTTESDTKFYKIDDGAYNCLDDLTDAINAKIELAQHIMVPPPSRDGGYFILEKVCDCDKAHEFTLS